MLWVLKRTVSMRWLFEHPKHMLKFIGKKILQFYAEQFCLSGTGLKIPLVLNC